MGNPFEATNLKGVKIDRSGKVPGLDFGRVPAGLEESYKTNLSIFTDIDNRVGQLDAEIDKLDKEGLLESIKRDVKEAEERVNKKTTGEKIAQWTSLASGLASAAGAFVSMNGAKKVASAAQVSSTTVDYSKMSDSDLDAKIKALTSEISTAKADLETIKGLKTTALNNKKTYNDLINDKTNESNEQQKIYKTQSEEYTKQDGEYKKQDGIVTEATSNLTRLNTAKTSAASSKAALESRENNQSNPLSTAEKAELAKLKGPATQEGSVAYYEAQITKETKRKSDAEKARNDAEKARNDAESARDEAAKKKSDADQVVKETTPKWEQASKDAEKYQKDYTKKDQEINTKNTELQNLQAEQSKRATKKK